MATPEATKGLSDADRLVQGRHIPKGAITWQEEQGRQAFQNGTLIFHRNWGYVYNLAKKNDGSSKVAGKFDVAPLPGITGPGVSSLGGHNYAIATNAENKGTAADFLKFMALRRRRSPTLWPPRRPRRSELYSDPDVIKKFPFMPIQKKSIEGASRGRSRRVR